MPFVPMPVTASGFKTWLAANGRGASFAALKTYANELFDSRLRELLASAKELTPRTSLPARCMLALTEEIGQDRANDVSHIGVVHRLMNGEMEFHPVLEDVRMFHEYALTLVCAHAVANAIDAVFWQKDQTYGWV